MPLAAGDTERSDAEGTATPSKRPQHALFYSPYGMSAGVQAAPAGTHRGYGNSDAVRRDNIGRAARSLGARTENNRSGGGNGVLSNEEVEGSLGSTKIEQSKK